MIRVYAVWLGVMLLGQSIATPWFENDEFFTLPPNMNYRVDIVEGVAQGIVGIQNVSTDRMGFRTNPPVDYQNKAALRIVSIGGSTTEEILLDDRATWTHQLQQGLAKSLDRPVEVINTGVSGLRARQHLATLNEVIDLRPDIALFLVGVNDWNKHIREYFGSKHYSLPIRLTPMTATCRVPPLSRVGPSSKAVSMGRRNTLS